MEEDNTDNEDESTEMSSDEEDDVFEPLGLEELVKMFFEDAHGDEELDLKVEQSCSWEADCEMPLEFLADLDEDTEFLNMCLDAAAEVAELDNEVADVTEQPEVSSTETVVSTTTISNNERGNEKHVEPSAKGSGDHEVKK